MPTSPKPIIPLLAALLTHGSFAADGLGIHSWGGWNPRQVSRADCPELRGVPLILGWNKLEPQAGTYKFDQYVGDPLSAAAKDDLHMTLMVWVRPSTPHWLFEMGVPKVYTDRAVNPLGRKMSKEDNLHPYYFHPTYKERFFQMIDALGRHVQGLPPELRKRIVFVQSAEGSTGDGQPYKGNPLDPQYAISKNSWNEFRQETWTHYQARFPGLPILVNSDANGTAEKDWLLDNMDVIALKHGMFSHGYHVSDNRGRLANFHEIQATARKRNTPVLTRGEMDGEMFVYGWSTRNIPQGLYWSGLLATHCDLDIWNIPHKALKDEANFPAFAFFNKYAGQRDPSTAPSAFCALRDGLDASDFERFPAEKFGGKPGQKRNKDRYIKIAAAFAKHGARMDDPDKALGGGMVNRKRSGSNDVGWGILPGNYSRFLTQLDPGSGDVGLWNIDDSIHGRFARAFEHESGKTQMRFKLDEEFFADPEEPQPAKLTVTWLDKGKGSWSLRYLGTDGKSRAKTVQKENSGNWKTGEFFLKGVTLNHSSNRPDLALHYESGDDTAFHMIELERMGRR